MRDSIDDLDFKEMDRNRRLISRAHLLRIQSQDNTLVHLVEMDSEECFAIYKDTYPCLDFRKKIWSCYL